jgi:glycosyltransferase involved in cell wall biosynthesis
MLRLYEHLAHRPEQYLAAADIFHSPHGPLPRPSTGQAAARRFLTIYDLIPLRFPQWVDAFNQRTMAAVYASLGPQDWALAISECTKADLCEIRGIDPARVFVTPLAAEPALFHPCSDAARQAAVRQKYGIPEGPYFLSLNTLEPRKNLEHAIRAFSRLVLQERLDDVSFVLVGSRGWKYEGIFQAVAAAGALRERIHLTGYVADEDLAALYSGALAFVYPSRYEGFGLPPLEAMQCGVPVVTADNSALPEVVGDAGILLDADDEAGLCEALLRLYGSAELRQQMREKSLARARLFSWERCVRQTLDAYRAALRS